MYKVVLSVIVVMSTVIAYLWYEKKQIEERYDELVTTTLSGFPAMDKASVKSIFADNALSEKSFDQLRELQYFLKILGKPTKHEGPIYSHSPKSEVEGVSKAYAMNFHHYYAAGEVIYVVEYVELDSGPKIQKMDIALRSNIKLGMDGD